MISRRGMKILTLMVVLGAFSILLSNGSDQPEGRGTRSISESDESGGMWYDDFSDNDGIRSSNGLRNAEEGMECQYVHHEDFESYEEGEDILGQGGWVLRDGNGGTFEASNNQTEGTIGVQQSFLSTSSAVLSSEFHVTRGLLELWVSTDKIDYSDHTTTQIALVDTTDNHPTMDDRIIGVGFNYDGLSYYTAASGWVVIASNLEINTWYRVGIDFDCTTDKLNLYVYDKSGSLLGSNMDVDFHIEKDACQRLQLNTGAGDTWTTTTYWDDFKLIDMDIETMEFHTTKIELPPGKSWSALRVDKEEPYLTSISIEIMDGNYSLIPGFFYDNEGVEFDLGPLNDLDVHSISLNFTFMMEGVSSPLLKGWGVEWVSERFWRDTFLTSFRIDEIDQVENTGGVLSLGEGSGYVVSEAISVPDFHYWGEIVFSYHAPPQTSLTFDILDFKTGDPISGLTNLTEERLNLSDIDPTEHTTLRIRGNFVTYTTESPKLYKWSLGWYPDTAPEVDGITSAKTICRTQETVIKAHCKDVDEEPYNLSFDAYCRKGEGESWSKDYIKERKNNRTDGTWEVIFAPPVDAQLGYYSFYVHLTDELGLEKSTVFENIIEVRNNRPQPPIIKITPDEPTSNDDIITEIVEPGSDVEKPYLFYDYLWYVNEDMVREDRNLTEDESSNLPSSHLNKDDQVTCMARSFDGEGHSGFTSVSVKVVNSKPTIKKGMPGSITLDEDTVDTSLDLSDHTRDIDMERLYFDHYGGQFVNISITENGLVMVTPDANWSGTDVATFVISDHDASIERDLTIVVLPVNDRPVISGITASSTEIEEGGFVILEVNASDIDGDNLTIEWTNDQDISFQMMEERINATIPTVGFNNITVSVSDGEYTVRETIGITVLEKPEREEDNFLIFLMIGILLAVVILLIIGGIILLLNKRSEGEKDPEKIKQSTDTGSLQDYRRPPPMRAPYTKQTVIRGDLKRQSDDPDE